MKQTKQLTASVVKKRAAAYFNKIEAGKAPTFSGLVYCLGFSSKEGFFDFLGDRETKEELGRAYLFLESYIEGLLYDKNQFQTAKFILGSQFSGWGEKEGKNQLPVYIVDNIVSQQEEKKLKKENNL